MGFSFNILQFFYGCLMALTIPSISTVCNEGHSKMSADIEKAPVPQTGTDGEQPDAAGISTPDERLLDWSSPDDPDCGQNWALPVKIYHTMVASAIGFLM